MRTERVFDRQLNGTGTPVWDLGCNMPTALHVHGIIVITVSPLVSSRSPVQTGIYRRVMGVISHMINE